MKNSGRNFADMALFWMFSCQRNVCANVALFSCISSERKKQLVGDVHHEKVEVNSSKGKRSMVQEEGRVVTGDGKGRSRSYAAAVVNSVGGGRVNKSIGGVNTMVGAAQLKKASEEVVVWSSKELDRIRANKAMVGIVRDNREYGRLKMLYGLMKKDGSYGVSINNEVEKSMFNDVGEVGVILVKGGCNSCVEVRDEFSGVGDGCSGPISVGSVLDSGKINVMEVDVSSKGAESGQGGVAGSNRNLSPLGRVMLKRGVKGCVSCPIIFRGPGSDFGPNKSVEHVSCCSEGALVLA
ncbi:hypothetical protein TSUD_158660 [Trifolium subterraneum]|uniref:Uncharacterized protein n=1 Tax=Trifolium subterraneum TaxID=3900 RepID=A0A2Z6NPG4_TRISU|nr:hypothetical protein TSUD_158660 [Trifolium subterraneum]